MAGPPVPTPSPPPTYNPQRDADRYTILLWNHIGMRIVNLLKNHHIQHEPGGLDQVKLPLGSLKDVQFSVAPVNGNVLKYNGAWKRWEAGVGGGGGAIGQAFFEAAGSIAVGVIPGPLNLSGSVLTITQVVVSADGEVSGAVTGGGGFAFAAGGGTDNNVTTYPWTNNRG